MPTNKKESFILYHSDWELIKTLKDSQLGLLIRAIFYFHLGLAPIKIKDKMVEMAFNYISNHIKQDSDKYQQVCEKRAHIASESQKKRHNVPETKKTSKCKQKPNMLDDASKCQQNEQTQANASKINDTDNDNDNEYENVCVCGNDFPTTTTPQFIEYLAVFFFRNIQNPLEVTRCFVDYYDSADWTLEHGDKLDTLKKRLGRAKKWDPRQPHNSPRIDPEFLNLWKGIYARIKADSPQESILLAALDNNIHFETTRKDNGTLYILLPPIINAYLREHLADYHPFFQNMIEKLGERLNIENIDLIPYNYQEKN